MNMQEIIEQEESRRSEWERTTKVGDYTIAELRKVSDAVFNPHNWKAPWAASVPHQLVGAVLAATEFFHADKATVHGIEQITGKVIMSGNGYQAD